MALIDNTMGVVHFGESRDEIKQMLIEILTKEGITIPADEDELCNAADAILERKLDEMYAARKETQ